jgi:hypothetical protein
MCKEWRIRKFLRGMCNAIQGEAVVLTANKDWDAEIGFRREGGFSYLRDVTCLWPYRHFRTRKKLDTNINLKHCNLNHYFLKDKNRNE